MILYFVNASVGNPSQPVRLQVDTGSSDLWINTPRSALCAVKSRPCAASGTYEPASSSSSRVVGRFFNISYVDGSGASGDYVTDTFRIAGKDVDDFQFGVGYSSSSPQAVLGIGYPANEAYVSRSQRPPYPNLPVRMASGGIIAAAAYSLWFNDVDADEGAILFGGVDKARFEGPLVGLPVQKVDGRFSDFFVTMMGLAVSQAPVVDNLALAVLDSGSSFTYLPDDLVQPIYRMLNAWYVPRDGVAYVPCSLRDDRDATVTFRFSAPAAIDVSLREVVIDPRNLPAGKPVNFDNGAPACYLGILPSDSASNKSISVLGDTFLRSAYVVYNMDNNMVYLAKTKPNVKTSDIQEIGTGADGVPQAVPAQDPVAATSGIPVRSSRRGDDSDNAAAGVPAPSLTPVVLALAVSLLVVVTA